MSDPVLDHGGPRRAPGAPSGKHAFDEDDALTPIFTALARGEAVDEFRRDPLGAPIPAQALVAALTRVPAPAPRRSGRRRAHPDTDGRHALLAG